MFLCRLITAVFLSALLVAAVTSRAPAAELEPFRTANRNPLIQGFGIPTETSAQLVPHHHWQISLSQDIASLYSSDTTSTEQILLDGELYRWGLIGRYGLTSNLEVGFELPYLQQTSGFLDSFIIDWHRFWGLPQGGRDTATNDRLQYRYSKNGITLLDIHSRSDGIGDISLLAGYQLFEQKTATDHDLLVLRSQLKLPTGDSAALLGSGSTDVSLFLSGSMQRQAEWGLIAVFGSAGGMYTSSGELLEQQRYRLIGFGTAGFGWSPSSSITLKAQCSFTSPFYKDSSLSELGKATAQVTFGGTLNLPGALLLDIALSEDIAVATAPDVTFHLGLAKRF